jgi:hypothetical protein
MTAELSAFAGGIAAVSHQLQKLTPIVTTRRRPGFC